MPRFYFNFVDGQENMEEPEGMELPDEAAAGRQASYTVLECTKMYKKHDLRAQKLGRLERGSRGRSWKTSTFITYLDSAVESPVSAGACVVSVGPWTDLSFDRSGCNTAASSSTLRVGAASHSEI
jgi:hypothetical protein